MANVMDVYKNLPQTNCKKCSQDSCMSFAMKLLKGSGELSACTPLSEDEYKDKKEKLSEFLSKSGDALETGHVMRYELCNGCGNCVVVCPVTPAHDSGGGKDPESKEVVWTVVDGQVKIINIKKCRRLGDDSNCSLCKDARPFGVIDLV